MSARLGVVRVLPPDTPGVPRPGAWWRGEAPLATVCHSDIPVEAVPLPPPGIFAVAYICTTDAFECDGIHVCHFAPSIERGERGEIRHLIVWGGE